MQAFYGRSLWTIYSKPKAIVVMNDELFVDNCLVVLSFVCKLIDNCESHRNDIYDYINSDVYFGCVKILDFLYHKIHDKLVLYF